MQRVGCVVYTELEPQEPMAECSEWRFQTKEAKMEDEVIVAFSEVTVKPSRLYNLIRSGVTPF
jgi:hypothetical protein